MRGTDDLRNRWAAWEAGPYPTEQYPPGSESGQVSGVDLALTDADVGSILDDAFIHGSLSDDSRALLPHVLTALEVAVPLLEGRGRAYFTEALALVRAVSASSKHA